MFFAEGAVGEGVLGLGLMELSCKKESGKVCFGGNRMSELDWVVAGGAWISVK